MGGDVTARRRPEACEVSMMSTQGDMPAGPAPQLGQHTAAILAELGYSAGEIEALAGSGVAR